MGTTPLVVVAILRAFSTASKNVVTTLSLDIGEFHESDVDVVKAVMESEDPLRILCEKVCGQTPIVNRRRSCVDVGLNKVTSICNGSIQTVEFEESTVYKGELVFFDSDLQPSSYQRATTAPDSPVLGFFVPGLGFCEATNPLLPACWYEWPARHQRIQSTPAILPREPALETLQFADEFVPDAFIKLLKLLGCHLRAVGFDVRDMDEEIVGQVFAVCPHLESFATSVLILRSMEIFTQAYGTYDLPLSSLSLPSVAAKIPLFESLLQSLTESNSMTATLQRLKLGSIGSHLDPFWASTACAFKEVVTNNKVLTHFTIHASLRQCMQLERELACYKGRLMPLQRPTKQESARRLAFLGAVRRIGTTNPRIDLDADVKEPVLEYAAPLLWRCVILEPTPRHWYLDAYGHDYRTDE